MITDKLKNKIDEVWFFDERGDEFARCHWAGEMCTLWGRMDI